MLYYKKEENREDWNKKKKGKQKTNYIRNEKLIILNENINQMNMRIRINKNKKQYKKQNKKGIMKIRNKWIKNNKYKKRNQQNLQKTKQQQIIHNYNQKDNLKIRGKVD